MKLTNVAKMWLKALKSGEYKQTNGRLQENGRYCCLGVLTDLAVKNGVICKFRSENDSGLMPTKTVKEWIGLKNEKRLASLNDNKKSFKFIANYIEQHPNLFFKEK